jgi:hypothetical protein
MSKIVGHKECYCMMADEAGKIVLAYQAKQIYVDSVPSVTCPCGKVRTLSDMYKCLYCGVVFCFHCAEEHFGQTLNDWVSEKRRNVREKYEATKNSNSKGSENAETSRQGDQAS